MLSGMFREPWFLPRLLLVSGALLSAAGPLAAQDPMRPWLPWRTLAAANYRFHFPAELEPWARHVAERVRGTDSTLRALVGYFPDRTVHVVIDDPFGASNGYALPFLEQPTSVWWATPPDPRSVIGNYTTWGELLAVHELAHLAHLGRPSRNPVQRALWRSLPAGVGPIARKSPRWLFEGYATYIEGLVTGSGRPNSARRAAVLRQWAIEGQLPGYSALNGSDEYFGGALTYLGGSAFLEWLVEREGDSSLVHLWRRMTARQSRGFNSAFSGVFGDTPAALYGVHRAELTHDAMRAKSLLERAGLVEGELVQRLTWETGDPAVSPKGDKVAIVLRERERPARVVVWSTAEEPEDTAAVRKRLEALRRDPQDVPDRRFHPRIKKALKTLLALNGRPFLQPRWFPDNQRVLLTRWGPRADGTVAPDLWIWDTESDELRAVTSGARVQHGDPSRQGREAVATQCRAGRCDIALVDLERRTTRPLLRGSEEVSYYRPRWSPDGTRIAAARSYGGRWRIVVADSGGGHMSPVDPDDGANRYDAEWMSDDSLAVVSEAGGIPNLEIIALQNGRTRSLTRVTGSAAAPSLNRADSSIWFLSLHARGLDVRRLLPAGRRADTVVTVSGAEFGFAGFRRSPGLGLSRDAVEASRPYGSGPRLQRWFPGGYRSGDGAGGFVTVFSGDIVGRLNAAVTGAYGQRGTVRGGALRATWRHPRPAIELGLHGFLHEPSLASDPQPGSDSLDAAVSQHVLAATMSRGGDGWHVAARAGGSAGSVSPQRTGGSHFRGLGFGEAAFTFLQGRGSRVLVQRLRLHATQGHARAPFQRAVGSFEIETSGRDMIPFSARGVMGRLTGSPHPYEQFVVGGSAPPVGDSSAMSQRHAFPLLPTGVGTGRLLMVWRLAFPTSGWTAYYEGASASDSLAGRRWHRAVGLETRLEIPPIPAAFMPRIRARAGTGYLLDAPFRRRVRGYLELQLEP